MFKCKSCLARDAHIESLQKQIALLTQLAVPSNDPHNPPLLNIEADAILSGHQHPIAAQEAEMPSDEVDAEIAERDRILSGAY